MRALPRVQGAKRDGPRRSPLEGSPQLTAAITPRREGYTSPGRETEVNDAEAGQRVDLRTALLALALLVLPRTFRRPAAAVPGTAYT